MASDGFSVHQIDHVELFVPDRYEAAEWYGRVFGLEIVRNYEDWAAGGGPLMVSSDGGSTMLALFEGEPQRSGEAAGFHRVAFRVDGERFMWFLDRTRELELPRSGVVDHEKAYSIYFRDPYGNPFEITTYDYEHVGERL